jgi:enterochelin esterase-like enzyme
MPVHPFQQPKGRIETRTVESAALTSNMLGDPSARQISVYLPEGYAQSDADYPLFVDLVGFTGSGPNHLACLAFEENVPQRLDRLIAAGKMGPVIAVFPDCFTSLGGNQYINSVAMGHWEDYLLGDVIPRVEEDFRLRRGAAHRAVFGKSSGGYGALVHGLRHGEHWGAVACHSGDVGFEVVYHRDLYPAQDALALHGGSVQRFLEYLRTAQQIRSSEMHALMLLAMAATYVPDPEAHCGARLPIDPHTGELDRERWARWLEHDPLRMIERPECQSSLRSLKGIYLDCGSTDQYFIHYGTRAFVKRLSELGIAHLYEEFDGGHSGIDHRMDRSLPFLFGAVGSG